jgi:CheY-like chemotaxis protein
MPRILVVDDNEGALRLIAEILEAEGHDVTATTSGAVALRSFRIRPFDLVITDILMPEVDGIETIIALREIEPNVRIIATSAGGRLAARDCLAMARGLRVSGTLGKPLSRAELLDAVADALHSDPSQARAGLRSGEPNAADSD